VSITTAAVDLDLNGAKETKRSSLFDGKLNRILDLPVVRREDMDGVKVYLGETGWVMVALPDGKSCARVFGNVKA